MFTKKDEKKKKSTTEKRNLKKANFMALYLTLQFVQRFSKDFSVFCTMESNNNADLIFKIIDSRK